MKNYFVGCGGTGAHVMLAMVRLHILGYPFGLFNKGDSKKFPDLILVDQDTTTDNGTAWAKVHDLLKKHPGRFKPRQLFASNQLPLAQDITPLPNKNFATGEEDNLKDRFKTNALLTILTSEKQREIRYSLGMMASPAVGSLLFKLKDQDSDGDYNQLLNQLKGSPVVVCGSIVGGTGASVAPTLTQILYDEGAKVMSVLIHRWFELNEKNPANKINEEAKARNIEMIENASCGLAFSGEDLATKVATVLVGIPNSGLVSRDWAGDTKQPSSDSHTHVVAAIASIRHLLDDEVGKGLYGVSASNSKELTDDLWLGDTNESALGVLYHQAKTLVHILKMYCDALNEYESESEKLQNTKTWLNIINYGSEDFPKLNVCQWVLAGLGDQISQIPKVVTELENIISVYDDKEEGILGWLRKLGIPDSNQGEDYFALEIKHIERIRSQLKKGNNLPVLNDEIFQNFNDENDVTLNKEEFIALLLFHWTADWIKDSLALPNVKNPTDGKVLTGYWPEAVGGDGLEPSWNTVPGKLGQVKSNNIGVTLDNYFKISDLSANGWPHPVSVVRYFKFLLKKKDRIALRKLELLLVGYATGILKLEELNVPANKDTLFDNLARGYNSDLASHRLVHHRKPKIYGFNSPDTLFCPVLDITDADWRDLWQEINGYTASTNWKSSNDWVGHAKDAENIITFWAKQLLTNSPNNLSWLQLLVKDNSDAASSFGIADWIKITGTKESIPLPILGYSTPLPNIIPVNPPINLNTVNIPKFKKCRGFKIITNASLLNIKFKINLIWKDHLDALQEEEIIFAWGKKDETTTWIIKIDNGQFEVITIENLKVIDVESIKVPHCIPLQQNPVPGSNHNRGDVKFPDLPILADYISLVETSPGNRLIDTNWAKISPYTTDRQNTEVRWEIYFAGRPNPESIVLPIDDSNPPTNAHWMVWPNFKSANPALPWKAYYIYEHSTNKDLEVKVLALDADGMPSQLYERPATVNGPS